MRRRATGLGALAVSLAVAGLAAAIAAADRDPPGWNDPVAQWAGIRFSHRLHLGEVEAECRDCHADAWTSRVSDDLLLPGHPQCAACHDVEAEGECATCHGEGVPGGWLAPERELSFDHHLHVGEGAVECARCHAGVTESEAPSLANLPRMETCTTCHAGEQVPSNCETCHRRMESLVPSSHREVDWIEEHRTPVRTGRWENDCAACHSESDCQVCHVEPSLQAREGTPRLILPEGRPAPSGTETLALRRVHGLDYVFTHPTDVRSKVSDCRTCHDPQGFCVECHRSTQEAGFAPPVPLGHGAVGFVRLGVGSGGGTHAELARRDIESCASCHDVEGRDPVCITCHVDRIPGLGNDPRTHSADIRDREGEWHSDPGAVCFNCHTSSGRAGIGFCGYCHGAQSED